MSGVWFDGQGVEREAHARRVASLTSSPPLLPPSLITATMALLVLAAKGLAALLALGLGAVALNVAFQLVRPPPSPPPISSSHLDLTH